MFDAQFFKLPLADLRLDSPSELSEVLSLARNGDTNISFGTFGVFTALKSNMVVLGLNTVSLQGSPVFQSKTALKYELTVPDCEFLKDGVCSLLLDSSKSLSSNKGLSALDFETLSFSLPPLADSASNSTLKELSGVEGQQLFLALLGVFFKDEGFVRCDEGELLSSEVLARFPQKLSS